MSRKDIKELARMTMTQCKDKLVFLIKECGDIEDLDFRIFFKTFDDVIIIKAIKDGHIYFNTKNSESFPDGEYLFNISDFTMDELYTIIKFL